MNFERDCNKPVAALELVKLTAFETLAATAVPAKNKREKQLKLLQDIMQAYSYIICVLKLDPWLVTLDDILSTNRHITLVVNKENDRIKKSASGNIAFHSKAECYPDTYIWARVGYYKDNHWNIGIKSVHCPANILFNQSSYWSEWKKDKSCSLYTLTAERLQRDLWDADRQQIKYFLLSDFIKNYPWAFPPNVVELHKELVAKEAAL